MTTTWYGTDLRPDSSSTPLGVCQKIDTTGFVLQAKDSGAKGYISKVAKEEELAHCLEVVQNGGTYIEQYMAEAQNKIDSIVSVLSKQDCFGLVKAGAQHF